MNRLQHILWASLLLCAALCVVPSSAASATISTDRIVPGMKGYGLTVFSGTEPERFEVEVVDVIPNFMLRQNIILITCSHPVTDHAGVIGGMSGSPIYLEGKLAGALAYGWRFSKDALAGVTPIAAMQDLLKRRNRAVAAKPTARRTTLSRLLDPAAWFKEQFDASFFGRISGREDAGFVPARMPLSLSGFTEHATRMLSDTLSPFGLDAVQSGGQGRSDSGPDRFVPGSAIGVQLVRGDLSASGIGTVTSVEDRNVLAFGHPMFNMGEGLLPVTAAQIHTVVASLARSNKMGSPLRELGALVQDRTAAIVARTDVTATMIPVRFHIEDTLSGIRETYAVEVADRQWLTGRLIHASLIQFIQHASADVTDVSAEVVGTLKIQGRPPITIDDAGVSRAGIAPLITRFRPAAAIDAILNNPFSDTAIEWVEMHVKLRYGLSHATITGVYLTSPAPAAGEQINLHVRLRHYGGTEEIRTIPFVVPLDAAGNAIRITAGGGNDIAPRRPMPESLDDLIGLIRHYHPSRSLVIRVETETDSLSIRGTTLEDLPASAVHALNPVAGSDTSTKYKTTRMEVIPTDVIVSGQHSVRITPRQRSH